MNFSENKPDYSVLSFSHRIEFVVYVENPKDEAQVMGAIEAGLSRARSFVDAWKITEEVCSECYLYSSDGQTWFRDSAVDRFYGLMWLAPRKQEGKS